MSSTSTSAVTHRTDSSITFTVHDVNVGEAPGELYTTRENIEAALATGFDQGFPTEVYSVEACSSPDQAVIPIPFANALIGAVHVAFARHLPLTLSPDMIWLAIAQGFAQHIGNNPETLREAFVLHQGQATITVERPDFVLGSQYNPWPEVFEMMAGVVHGEVGPIGEVLTADFSTTGPIERAASQVVMMGAFKPYFRYVLACVCGIPNITLEGTAEDWQRLKGKVECLRSYDCDWWIRELLPIADQFVRAANGDVDTEFWKRIYKIEEVYGGENVEGWIGKLFPYVKNGLTGQWDQRNPMLEQGGAVLTSGVFPPGFTDVPFTFQTEEESHNMHFLAGFTGVTCDEKTKAVRPSIGWAVCQNSAIEKVLQRMMAEGHEMRPPRSDVRKLTVDESGRQKIHPILELDPILRRFYETCDGGELFHGAYRIVSLAEFCGKRGPSWRWEILGSLGDGSQLIMGEGIIRFRLEEGPQLGTVVALTLTEFLQRALDSEGALYMDAPEFEPYPFPQQGDDEFHRWSLYYGSDSFCCWEWESKS